MVSTGPPRKTVVRATDRGCGPSMPMFPSRVARPVRAGANGMFAQCLRPLRRRPVSAAAGMLAYVRRTTVKLPDDLDARLRHEAARRGVTVSELTREAIETLLVAPRGRRRLLAAGAGASGRADISERIEEILATEVGPSR
jgi:predicted transcriptional regulator